MFLFSSLDFSFWRMEDNGENKRSARLSCSGGMKWEDSDFVLCFQSSVFSLSTLPPPHSMWGISWTKKLKGSNWFWCFKELNVYLLDLRDCQIYEEHLQILSLEKVSMIFLKHLNKVAEILKVLKTSASTLSGGVLPSPLLHPLSLSPSLCFDHADEATLLCFIIFSSKNLEGNKTLEKQQGLISTVSMRPLFCSHWDCWQKSQ